MEGHPEEGRDGGGLSSPARGWHEDAGDMERNFGEWVPSHFSCKLNT